MGTWILGAILFDVVVCVAALIYGTVKSEKQMEKIEIDKIEKECGTSRNAFEASELIGKFVEKRDWVCRFDVCYSNKVEIDGSFKRMWLPPLGSGCWAFHGKGFVECTFIRLCHKLGCEVILRQVGTADGKDESEYEQVKTRMSEDHRRKNISMIYSQDKKVGDWI